MTPPTSAKAQTAATQIQNNNNHADPCAQVTPDSSRHWWRKQRWAGPLTVHPMTGWTAPLIDRSQSKSPPGGAASGAETLCQDRMGSLSGLRGENVLLEVFWFMSHVESCQAELHRMWSCGSLPAQCCPIRPRRTRPARGPAGCSWPSCDLARLLGPGPGSGLVPFRRRLWRLSRPARTGSSPWPHWGGGPASCEASVYGGKPWEEEIEIVNDVVVNPISHWHAPPLLLP